MYVSIRVYTFFAEGGNIHVKEVHVALCTDIHYKTFSLNTDLLSSARQRC